MALIQRAVDRVKQWYFVYELRTSLYMLEPWEKGLFSKWIPGKSEHFGIIQSFLYRYDCIDNDGHIVLRHLYLFAQIHVKFPAIPGFGVVNYESNKFGFTM